MSSQPGGSGGARVFDRGASLEDTVKQQAATIHAQALKLYQLQVRLSHSLRGGGGGGGSGGGMCP